MAEHLLFKIENKIATITLNRPEQLNSFSLEMITQWIEALAEVRDRDDIRVLVLTGNGRAFSTGGDIKAIINKTGFFMQSSDNRSLSNEIGLDSGMKRKNTLWKHIQRIPLLLQEIDKPVIAAVNGIAVGAGMDMSLACDIRFCSDKARFVEGYIKLGVVPGDGGAFFLPRIVGIAQALELLWTGDEIDANRAKELGLVSRVIPHDNLLEETYEFANKLAAMSPEAIQMIKRSVYQGLNLDLRSALDMISSHMAVVTDTESYKDKVNQLVNSNKRKDE